MILFSDTGPKKQSWYDCIEHKKLLLLLK